MKMNLTGFGVQIDLRLMRVVIYRPVVSKQGIS